MNRSVDYSRSLSNYGSAYNGLPDAVYQAKLRSGVSSSFYPYAPRPSSPLFHRSTSPQPASWLPLSSETGPRFNFDLYKMNETFDELIDPPPSSLTIHHHHSIYSPPSSPSSALSKLRQINDELCHTLAQTERTESSPTKSGHYHIHHYPVSQTYRSRTPPERHPAPVIVEASPKVHKARVTYKIHIPSRHRPERSAHSRREEDYQSASDDDPVVIDMYPSRDRGFQPTDERHQSDRRSPWVVQGKSLRRSSYSDTSASQAPSERYYDDTPIESQRQSTHRKDRLPSSLRHPAPFLTSRSRHDHGRAYEPEQFREPAITFSRHSPANSHRRSNVNGAQHSPSKSARHPAPWDASGVKPPSKHILAFDSPRESSPKADLVKRIRKHVTDGTESDQVSQRRAHSDRPQIRQSDPKLKRRVAETESKVKSAWEPTVNGIRPETDREHRRPSSSQVKKPTMRTPPKERTLSEPTSPVQPSTRTNTDRSSVKHLPAKPVFQSPPKEPSTTDFFEGDSPIPDQAKKPEKPRSPPPPAVKQPEIDQSIQERASKKIKNERRSPILSPSTDQSASKNNSTHSEQSTPVPSKPQPPPPKPKSDAAESVDEYADENDQEVARSFDFSNWLRGASETIATATAQKKDETTPTIPAPAPPAVHPKVVMKITPRRKEQPSSPVPSSPDHNLYKPPFGPKRPNPLPAPAPAPTPPPATTTTTAALPVGDDFFS